MTHLYRGNSQGEILDADGKVVGRIVPPEATYEQWSGLARDFMMGLDMGYRTPEKLFRHLECLGHEIPQWLRDEPEMQNLNHVPSKGTRVVMIYKAMLSAAPADWSSVAVRAPETTGFDGPFAAGMQHALDAILGAK